MKPFEVGDKVWSFQKGDCVVQEIVEQGVYPLLAGNRRYTKEGKSYFEDKYQLLYHLEDAKRLFPSFFEPVVELEPCSLCGHPAECSDLNSRLIQCGNGVCKLASWGAQNWNDNQKMIRSKNGTI